MAIGAHVDQGLVVVGETDGLSLLVEQEVVNHLFDLVFDEEGVDCALRLGREHFVIKLLRNII